MQMSMTRAFATLGSTAAALALVVIMPALGATGESVLQSKSKPLVAAHKTAGQQTVAQNAQPMAGPGNAACINEFKNKIAKGDLPKDADQDGYVKYCMASPVEPTQRPTAASAAELIKIEVIPPVGRTKDGKDAESDDVDNAVGDIAVTWGDGRREQLTHGVHAEQAKMGPDGLIGWTWGKERYRKSWINEHLRVQRGKRLLFEVKPEMHFIEDWAFAPEGLIVKSRMAHGPARIELFSLSNGKRIKLIEKAYEDDGDNLPSWARPFAD